MNLNDPAIKQQVLDRLARVQKSLLACPPPEPEPRRTLTTQELATLSDEELYEAVLYRMEKDDADGENLHRELFKILSEFDMEMQNGGLCQYFVNSGRANAPMASQALSLLGAAEHQALYEAFIADNGIDLSVLDAFAITDVTQYRAKILLYPFDAFDEAYYALPPLFRLLTKYIREHIAEF